MFLAAYQAIVNARKIDGLKLLTLGDTDFAEFEEDYYSVSEDTAAVRTAIAEIQAGGIVVRHAHGKARAAAPCEHGHASDAANPEWLTQQNPDVAASDLAQEQTGSESSDGLHILVGHPNGTAFVLLFCFNGKVERKQIRRERLGSTFTIDNQHVCENKTLQGFVLFLQSDGDENPLPCVLSQAGKGGGGPVIATRRIADVAAVVSNPHFELSRSHGFETPSSIQILTSDSPRWVANKDRIVCAIKVCSKKFSALVRRHHCRICGDIVCATCSQGRIQANEQKKMERACKDCMEKNV